MSDNMTTESSELTDLDDIDMPEPPPLSTAQKAYEYLVPLIDKFTATVEKITLPADRKEDWLKTTQSLKSRAYQKPHKVAIVGRTGAGKSTLLNALLQHQLLSASAAGACTAVPTEISYKDVQHIEADVEFISREEWRKEVCRLIEDTTDKTVDTSEGPADHSDIGPAYQSREKLLGVYPCLRGVDPAQWVVEDLLNDPQISQYLGGEQSFSASESANFQKELDQFLASGSLTNSDTRKFWPLVKMVKIRGKFDVLFHQCTLVDLPGYGDSDNARDSTANEYLKSADSVFLVAGITRAKDDRDFHSSLHKQIRQSIIDGRIRDKGEKSISLILTGADSSIGSNECTLEAADQQTVDTLKEEALRLSEEIKDLAAKKAKKEQSKAKKKNVHIQQYNEQISEKKAQKESKTKEKNRLLANGRRRIVEAALQDKYAHLYRDLSQLSEDKPVPTIPIFCLGSRDYLCLADIEPDAPTTFFTPAETGIPQLKRYLETDGECRNLTDAIEVLKSFYEFLSRASQFPKSVPSNAAATLQTHNILEELEQRCVIRLDELLVQIKKVYADLQAEVATAVEQAQDQSPRVFAVIASKMKWNQYRAMMRLDGQYENGNLNADLVKNILPAIQRQWNISVNNRIPVALDSFYDDIRDDIRETIDLLSCPGSTTDVLRKSLGLETFLTELKSANEKTASSAQRQGSRTWEPVIKDQLVPQYAKVSAEKGPGMYKRMKAVQRRLHRKSRSRVIRNYEQACRLSLHRKRGQY
ncbi:hypothetical protein C8R44DRAFT_265806 [Mycena epipterygia]|nr:hypothetical protein C8R44DRAFT_265806 [Mycena epipterygia]